MSMKRMSVESLHRLLCSIRTKGIDEEAEAKELLSLFAGDGEWNYQQCRSFYKSLLELYVDDKDKLELLLAVSGVLEGYRNILVATERRDKYIKENGKHNSFLQHRSEDGGPVDDMSTLKSREDSALKNVAKCIVRDFKRKIVYFSREDFALKKTDSDPVKPSASEAQESGSEETPRKGLAEDEKAAEDKSLNLGITVVVNHENHIMNSADASASATNNTAVISAQRDDEEGEEAEPLDVLPPPSTAIDTGTVKELRKPKQGKRMALIRILSFALSFAIVFSLGVGAGHLLVPGLRNWNIFGNAPEITNIFVPENVLTLPLGESRQLEVAVLPQEAAGAKLSYVSSDPDVVIVSADGVITALREKKNDELVDIIIQAENGVSQILQVNVPNSQEVADVKPTGDVLLETHVRRLDSNEYLDIASAQPGEVLEWQIHYKNISEISTKKVIIKAVLPSGLEYMQDTTKIYNTAYETGIIWNNNILTTGINIGGYAPNGDGYVRFRTVVTKEALEVGSLVLYLWGQVNADGITAQDSAHVFLGP